MDWRRDYSRRLWASDLLVLAWVVYGTQLAMFGFGAVQVSVREDSRLSEFSYWMFSGVLVLAWMWALGLRDSRADRVIGTGVTEYVRIAEASFRLFAIISVIAYLTRANVARGFLLLGFPIGVVVLIIERWLWRKWLNAMRATGAYSARVMLVGSSASAAQIQHELRRMPQAGYRIVGACVPAGRAGETLAETGIPIVGSVDDVDEAMAATGADTVIVTSTDDLPPSRVKQISWNLRPGRQHLVLAPSIVDIAGFRIHSRPVAGLPLIHVETPRFTQGQRLVKRMFDLVVSAVCIVLLSPVLVIVGLLVKSTSPGPLLFSHQRIGQGGRPFRMYKFRSMRQGAEKELETLLEEQGANEKPLFKVRNDPRITPIGSFLRKYSLDELPQLFNVLGGSMSLVGPRPQIAAEVALYSGAAHRRLIARPGITGLWQVSGRSELEWEDAVKLDLYYVENWSLAGDIMILSKTAGAVLAPGESAR